MWIIVEYITRTNEERSFELDSKFNRINAKGIKNEIENAMLQKFGYIGTIVDWYKK